MTKRFAAKTVLILGGNSGIGLAAARAFAAEGAQVVITGRSADSLGAAAELVGHGTIALRADIRDLGQIAGLFATVAQACGRIDVLVASAGVAVVLPVESVSESHWNSVMDTNLKGVFFSVQHALPLMSRGSAIVLIGSTASRKADPGVSVYAASKAALRALGRSLAGELIHRAIRANVVSPGPVETPMLERVEGIAADEMLQLKSEMIAASPMGRLGAPAEIAEAILFLASDAAAFITGTELLVDGGAASF